LFNDIFSVADVAFKTYSLAVACLSHLSLRYVILRISLQTLKPLSFIKGICATWNGGKSFLQIRPF
jgi:hypothetical protein